MVRLWAGMWPRMWLIIPLCAAAVCAGKPHMYKCSRTCSLSTCSSTQADWNRAQSKCSRGFSAGVSGAKIYRNGSTEMCRHPCDELLDLISEIHGLRVVTNSLLGDLEKVVRPPDLTYLFIIKMVLLLYIFKPPKYLYFLTSFMKKNFSYFLWLRSHFMANK